MTNLSDEFFEAALASVQERLADLITQPKSDSDPPDQWSKSFTTLMKAEETAQARLDQHRAKTAAKHHTRYEDMPPPTPEDEARFDAEFQKLLSSLFEEEEDDEEENDEDMASP